MRALRERFNDGASVMALTYLGATQIVPELQPHGHREGGARGRSVRYLAFDLGERGIRVNAISAGPIKTASSRQVGGFSRILDVVPQGRAAAPQRTPEDVGNIAVYLASDLSSAVTADVHFVDAGYHTMGMLPAGFRRVSDASSRRAKSPPSPRSDDTRAANAAANGAARRAWTLASAAAASLEIDDLRALRARRANAAAMFDKILIANRGEIAVRVIRTAREMGIATVAVYSEPDRDALHVRMADEAYLLGRPRRRRAISTPKSCSRSRGARAPRRSIRATVSWPRTPASRARVVAAGLVWIGPHAEAIDAMGDKLRARRAMTTPACRSFPAARSRSPTSRRARAAAEAYGLPLALKASGGGGGKGLKVARTLDEIDSAFEPPDAKPRRISRTARSTPSDISRIPSTSSCRSWPTSTATSCTSANATARCSADTKNSGRRRRRWISDERARRDARRRRARGAGDRLRLRRNDRVPGAGDEFYFLEMNTRIQVEHTVTRNDLRPRLIREQIRVAAGEPLGLRARRHAFRGLAIEGARQRRRSRASAFVRRPARLRAYREPGGLGVRVDSAALPGLDDSRRVRFADRQADRLGADRASEAIARLRRAIDEYVIDGVPTTLPILRALCDHPPVADGTTERRRSKRSRETFAPNGSPADPALPSVVPDCGRRRGLGRRDDSRRGRTTSSTACGFVDSPC